MHIRWSQHPNTNNVLVAEQYGFKKGISTEDAAFRLKDRVFKTIHKKKGMLEELSVIWQRLLIAGIMKFC